jgi:hypothetical protein
MDGKKLRVETLREAFTWRSKNSKTAAALLLCGVRAPEMLAEVLCSQSQRPSPRDESSLAPREQASAQET